MKKLVILIISILPLLAAAQHFSLSADIGTMLKSGDNPDNYHIYNNGATHEYYNRKFTGTTTVKLACSYSILEAGVGLQTGSYQAKTTLLSPYRSKLAYDISPEFRLFMSSDFALPFVFLNIVPQKYGRFHFNAGLLAGYMLQELHKDRGIMLLYARQLEGGERMQLEHSAAVYGLHIGTEYHLNHNFSLELNANQYFTAKMMATRYEDHMYSNTIDNIDKAPFKMAMANIGLGINYRLTKNKVKKAEKHG